MFSGTCSPASVSAFWDQLQDPVAKSVKLEGVSLEFASSPLSSAAPPCSVTWNPIKKQEIVRQVEDLVDSGRVNVVPLSSLGVWGQVFVVEQPYKMRLILDISTLISFSFFHLFKWSRCRKSLNVSSRGLDDSGRHRESLLASTNSSSIP